MKSIHHDLHLAVTRLDLLDALLTPILFIATTARPDLTHAARATCFSQETCSTRVMVRRRTQGLAGAVRVVGAS